MYVTLPPLHPLILNTFVYQLVEYGEYYKKYEKVSIEECAGELVTVEQFDAMKKVFICHFSGKSIYLYDRNLVTRKMHELGKQIPPKRVSIRVDDEELLEAYNRIKDFWEFENRNNPYVIKQGRLYLKSTLAERKRKAARKRDEKGLRHTHMIYLFMYLQTLANDAGMRGIIEINHSTNKSSFIQKIAAFEYLSKWFSWKEIMQQYNHDDEDVGYTLRSLKAYVPKHIMKDIGAIWHNKEKRNLYLTHLKETKK